MKKLLSIILCLILCFSLFACNTQENIEVNSSKNNFKNTPTVTSGTKATKSNKTNINIDLLNYNEGIGFTQGQYYTFDSYDRFLAHLSDKANPENSVIQDEKSLYGEKYERLVNELTEKEHIETPHINGKRMSLATEDNILLFSSSIYELPWIWYGCYSEWGKVTIVVSYPHVEEYVGFSENLSTLDILGLFDPYFENFKESTHQYEKEIEFSDRTLSTVVCEDEESDNVFVYVYYDLSLITFRLKQSVYNSDFFSQFSMQ